MKKNKVLKVMALLVCAILLVVGSVAGTFAYLTDKTESVKNTFTIGKIDIELKETDDEGNDIFAQSFKMIPGKEYTKDPTVTVKQGSEACWLFVKVEMVGNFDYLIWEIAEGWTELTEGSGIYWRKVDAVSADAEAPESFYVLLNNKVTIDEELTNATMPAEDEEPEMTFTAYAVQQYGFETAADAWEQVKTTYLTSNP